MAKALVVVGIFVTGIILFIMALIGWNNAAVITENSISASDQDRQTVLSNYTTKIQEMAQIPAMYRDDLTKVFKDSIGARYGADGSKALFQFIKEQNPNFDSSMYTKLQTVIDAGRTDYTMSEKVLIDKVRVYRNDLGIFPKSFFLSFLGFPKIDLEKMKPLVESATKVKFETGVDSAIKIR